MVLNKNVENRHNYPVFVAAIKAVKIEDKVVVMTHCNAFRGLNGHWG